MNTTPSHMNTTWIQKLFKRMEAAAYNVSIAKESCQLMRNRVTSGRLISASEKCPGWSILDVFSSLLMLTHRQWGSKGFTHLSISLLYSNQCLNVLYGVRKYVLKSFADSTCWFDSSVALFKSLRLLRLLKELFGCFEHKYRLYFWQNLLYMVATHWTDNNYFHLVFRIAKWDECH